MWHRFGQALYGGIRVDWPGHGGEACVKFLPFEMRVADTLVACLIMLFFFSYAFKKCKAPPNIVTIENSSAQRVFLVILSTVFGVQVGLKLASKSLMYMLNPCHIMTITQIVLLASPKNKYSVIAFRLLIHQVYGAAIAMLFPETGPLDIFGRLFFYWLQHILIFFIIPPFLVYIWGVDILEPFTDFTWAIFSGIFFGIHQLFVLQPLALLTHVNMNFILCPASMDPFHGPYYRLAAVFHQTACLLLAGKVYSLLLRVIISKKQKSA